MERNASGRLLGWESIYPEVEVDDQKNLYDYEHHTPLFPLQTHEGNFIHIDALVQSMNWIIYAVACVFLYGIMQFFIKLSSNNNAIVSSLFFVAAQFVAQLALGAFFISKSGFDITYSSIKYSILGGIAAAVATILFFLALENESLSKVVPIVNLNVVVGVLLGVFILKDEINLRIAAGIILAVISIYLLTGTK